MEYSWVCFAFSSWCSCKYQPKAQAHISYKKGLMWGLYILFLLQWHLPRCFMPLLVLALMGVALSLLAPSDSIISLLGLTFLSLVLFCSRLSLRCRWKLVNFFNIDISIFHHWKLKPLHLYHSWSHIDTLNGTNLPSTTKTSLSGISQFTWFSMVIAER